MNDTLLSLLREARREWIKDTRLEGDQYGMYEVPAVAAQRAFGARIDELLASMQRYVVIVTSKEARGVHGVFTADGERFWVTHDYTEHWDTSSRLIDENNIPPDVKTFTTKEKAACFAVGWKGHPWWCKPKSWEIVQITQIKPGEYVR